jgi:large subunit ribosomal protein L18
MTSKCIVAKLSSRARSKHRIRRKVSGSPERPRLSVFRSSKHMYAQLICDQTGTTLVSASTLDRDVQSLLSGAQAEKKLSTKCLSAAHAVGKVLAERGKKASISAVTFDRNGFKFCGRIKAVADGAREGGLGF